MASGRKSIVLPVGGGLAALEAHLGLPALEEDEAEWYRIRREFDESHAGVPATYRALMDAPLAGCPLPDAE